MAIDQLLIVYHFFPHYRKGVMSELAQRHVDGKLVFGGDLDSANIDPSIKPWQANKDLPFVHIPVTRLPFGKYIQWKLIWYALTTSWRAVILLGDANNISTWIAGALFRARGIRTIFWAHGWISDSEPTAKTAFRKLYFAIPDGLLFYGRRAKSIAVHYGVPPEKIWVVYNSLDYEAQITVRNKLTEESRRLIRNKLFGTSDIPIVVCISRITKLRRLDMLIQSLDKLKEEGHECGLLLIGDGAERGNLESQAAQCGIKLVCTNAIYDEAEIGPLLSCAAVTVAPGKVGLTAMHSLVYGVPVITHSDHNQQMPESEAIVPGITGDLFLINNIDDLAAKIQKWTQSPDVDRKTREYCFTVIDKYYNPAEQANIIEDAIGNVPQVIFNSNSIEINEIV
jgi:1,2-diacylglycerol 3-alpha-glucosyltransferase